MKTKTLILKISVLATLLVVTYIGLAYKTTQGNVDMYYSKFTHKGGSLIIGLSRARDGISPMIIEQEFNDKISKPNLQKTKNILHV